MRDHGPAFPDPHESIYAFMAYYLRFLRLQRGLTQADLAKILNCSIGQVSKYESGDKQLGTRECTALDKTFDTGGVFTIWLGYAKLGIDANAPSRLDRYQRRAIEHYMFASNYVPLPFQTEDYTRECWRQGMLFFLDDVDGALERRMELQDAMLDGRPEIWAVLDQVALRSMGPPEVMEAQWEHLLQMGRLFHVSIRILPLRAAPHVGIDGPFHCFTLPNRRHAAFSGGALGVGRVIDDQVEAAAVALRFNRIAARAWSEDQSREYLGGMSERLDELA